MNKDSKYAKLIDDTRDQICRGEIGVTGVFQLMMETLSQIEKESTVMKSDAIINAGWTLFQHEEINYDTCMANEDYANKLLGGGE